MPHIQETDLAWALIETAKPHLNVVERNYAFVTTGAGDTFAAILHLFKLIAAKKIPLKPSLVRLCVTWLDSYAFHDDEPQLRHLIEGFWLPNAVRVMTEIWQDTTSTASKSTSAFGKPNRLSYDIRRPSSTRSAVRGTA